MHDATSIPNTLSTKHSWLRNPTPRHILILSALLSVVVMTIVVVASLGYLRALISLQGEVLKSTDRDGVPVWYQLSLGRAERIAGMPGFSDAPVRVLEAVPYGGDQEYAVLAQVPGVLGVVVGILHANNTFETILADGSAKTDLAARPDGVALYSVVGPEGSELMKLSLTDSGSTPESLGRGRSPRLFNDGFFVAITQEGLVRIDPVSDTTTVLVENTDADQYNGSISPDGAHVAMSNTSGKTLLYRINRTSPTDVTLQSVSPFFALSPLVFVGERYLVEPGTKKVVIYERTATGLTNVGMVPIKN